MCLIFFSAAAFYLTEMLQGIQNISSVAVIILLAVLLEFEKIVSVERMQLCSGKHTGGAGNGSLACKQFLSNCIVAIEG